MSGQGIIGKRMALSDQVKIRLTGLEENLDLSTFAVDADDLLRSKLHVGANKGNPVFFVVSVANTDDPRRDLLIPAGQYIDRKQIFIYCGLCVSCKCRKSS